MKVLLVSDVTSSYIWDHFDRENFKEVSCVLSCGDLPAAYLEFIVTMLGVPLYYVPGNHDTSYLTNPPLGCESLDGRIAEVGGMRVLGLGGCRSPQRIDYQYPEEVMAKRVKKLRSSLRRYGGFDILLSHAPAYGLGDGEDLFHKGFQCFRDLLEQYRPRYHIYGHQHKGYSHKKPVEQHINTRLINVTGHKVVDL